MVEIVSRHTPAASIIKGLTNPTITVEELAKGKDFHAYCATSYGQLLMACEGDQLYFLLNLWDHFEPDHDVKIGWLGLIKAGFFLDCLERKGQKARDLLQAVQYCITQTKQRELYDQPGNPGGRRGF